MADEEFEIDIYGDAAAEQQDGRSQDLDPHAYDGDDREGHEEGQNEHYQEGEEQYEGDQKYDSQNQSAGGSGIGTPQDYPQQQAQQQGVKRKGGSDERVIDAGATTALLVSELNWWDTDDDIRGWAREANCEEELKDITFSEYKANGKSKGQAYVEFTSQQAATATKHSLDSRSGENAGQKKVAIIYTTPNVNPFKTLPKDAPGRQNKDMGNRPVSGTGYNDRASGNMGGGGNYGGNNYRGRGGYNGPRGGGGGGMNQGGYNRNFQGGNMNAYNNNNNNVGNMGFNNMGFNNHMGGGGGAGNFGFQPRGGGGMMGGGMRGGPGGMRGGRGGGPMNMMGGMPMNMGMGGMPGGMGGMGMMGGGMPGFQGMQPHFNPAFFGGGGGGGGGGNQPNEWQNPHGVKRQRPE